jgi:glycosyltransferase involved in cell wall biosynthesis
MRFSFIIPALDEEDYVGRCIKSIKNQTTEVFEIIVVDNGSKDKTSEIAKDLGARAVKEEERGISPARNAGARVAKGDYLCFVDADGVLSKNWLKQAKDTLLRSKRKAVVGMNIFTHESFFKKIWYNTYTIGAYTGMILTRIFFDRVFLSNNMVIRRDVFEKTGGFDPVTGEDIWLSRKFWDVGGKGEFNPFMLIFYSSRGFDSYGYLKTIVYWIVSTLKKSPSHNYNYKNKTYED